MPTATIGERLTSLNNRPSGFDYLRLILAVMVIATHTVVTSYGAAGNTAFWSYPSRVPFAMILPMFFALSGFLVAGSLERSRTIVSFLGLRVFRLVPALAFETTLSALVLGPIFTSLPLATYVSDPAFRLYFLNIVGEVHMNLPGVFGDLPLPNFVNLQLWTLPWELACYASLASLAVLSVFRRPKLFMLVIVGVELEEIVRHTFIQPFGPGITVGGPTLVLSFLFGVAFYLLKDRIPWSRAMFVSALIACVALGWQHSTSYSLPIPAAYVTIYLGLTSPPRLRLLLGGDYSYGLFLYGFPIQQAVTAMFPQHRVWWFNLVVSLTFAGALAVVSWWLLEKPLHDRRKVIFRLETQLLDWWQRTRNPPRRDLATVDPLSLQRRPVGLQTFDRQ